VQALGTEATTWLAVGHGIAGLAALVLAPWKTRVSTRGVARRNRGRSFSLAFAVVAIGVLLTGILHMTGLVITLGPVTTLWLHIALSLTLIPYLAWHVTVRRTLPRRTDLSRRNLLRLSGLAAAGVALWWGGEGVTRAAALAGARRRFTGSHETSSFVPAGVPVTSWLNDRVPVVDGETWRVTIQDANGLRSLSLFDLADLSNEEIIADLDCTSGWWSRQAWTGVRLDRLLQTGEAGSVLVRSVTGYDRRFPVRDLDRIWLATTVGDQPMLAGHGYPARLVIPGRRGFWWVKWVAAIETSDLPWWVQPPYPLS